MGQKVLISLFFIFGIIYVFFMDFIDDSYHMLFKLIPMLLLILLVLTTKVQTAKRYKWLIMTALIICAIGDYSLQWFIIGLSSFLIGHIFYIFAFRSANEKSTPRSAKILLLIYGAIMVIWVAGTLFNDNELVLAIAVVVYIAVILTMGWTAFKVGHRITVIGAITFIASDSILAVNRFILDIPFSHELIMFTYYGAQLLFALSVSKYDEIRQKVVQ